MRGGAGYCCCSHARPKDKRHKSISVINVPSQQSLHRRASGEFSMTRSGWRWAASQSNRLWHLEKHSWDLMKKREITPRTWIEIDNETTHDKNLTAVLTWNQSCSLSQEGSFYFIMHTLIAGSYSNSLHIFLELLVIKSHFLQSCASKPAAASAWKLFISI